MGVFKITSARGGLSDYEDKGIAGAFKFGSNLDVRKKKDTISAGQALMDLGDLVTSASRSPSGSSSPSASVSPSISPSVSPSASPSPSPMSASASRSPSGSGSPSGSASPSASISPSSSASPSPSPTAGLSTVFSDLIRSFVKCLDGNLYGFGHTGKVYKINPDLSVFQVYDLRKPITGAAEKPSVGGRVYLEFATRTEVHRKQIPGNSAWNDVDAAGSVQGDTWPKTNLIDADWHTMCNVAGSILIANDSYLAMSAYDDSYTNQALDLIPGNVAKALLERNGRAVIGTYLKSDPNKGTNGILDSEVSLMQVGNDGDIYYADFTNSVAVKKLPGGGKVNPGGMRNEVEQIGVFSWEQNALSWIDKQTIGNMALLAVYGATAGMGGVYTMGRRNKNHPFALNLEYALDADELGAVVNFNGTTLVSYRSGSSFGVKATDPNNKATFTYEGLDLKAPDKLELQITNWKRAELYMAPLPAGCSVQFWYRVDKDGSFIQAKTARGDTSYTTTGGKKASFRIDKEGDIFEPKIIGIPFGNTTAEIYRQKYFFA